jgi:hypothetical protein
VFNAFIIFIYFDKVFGSELKKEKQQEKKSRDDLMFLSTRAFSMNK